MKKHLNLTGLLLAVIITFPIGHAQDEQTSAERVEVILSFEQLQNELTRLDTGITTLLADERLIDPDDRQLLLESQTALNEMLNEKIGVNATKLVELAKWLRTQGEEKQAIEDAGVTPSPQQQFVIDNSLGGTEVYLTTILKGILSSYLEIDGETIGDVKLEALLQLYLSFGPILENSWRLADDFLLFSPQWIQARFPQLTDEEKQQFLKDINDSRAERAAGSISDQDTSPLPTPQEKAAVEPAYEAAYQFMVINTPPS